MRFSLVVFCLLLIVIYTSNSCSKSVTQHQNEELDDTITTFTFNTCSARRQGEFYPGVATNANDYIDYGVNVTNPGQWKFSTDTVNGIWLSDTGTFTSTGNQYMRVRFHGTPQEHGNFNFITSETPRRVTTFRVRQMDSLPPEAVPDGVYFKGEINGVNYFLTKDSAEPWHASRDYVGDTAYFTSHVWNVNGKRSIWIRAYSLTNYDASTPQDFFDFFKPGTRPYIAGCPPLLTGVSVSFSDSTHKEYFTTNVTGQEGSSFQITGMDTGYVDDWFYYVKVRMRFNCKLYLNFDDPNPIELKNGEMVNYFIRLKKGG